MKKNKKLNVCHIASGDLWAGAEAQVLNILEGLRRFEWIDLFAIIMNRGRLYRELIDLGVSAFLVDEKQHNLIKQVSLMRAFIKGEKINIIHSHRYKENILSCLINLSIRKKCRLIKTQHSSVRSPSTWKLRLYHKIDLMLTEIFFSKVVAVSEDIATEFTKFLPKKKVATIQNSIQTQKYNLLPNSGLEERRVRIGIAGRLVPVKNIEEFIRIAVNLKKEGCISEALIAGDGPLKSKLKELVRKNDAQGYISFLGHLDEMSTFFNKIDVLLITSSHEGIPTVLLEGLYFGKTVVAHRVGGIPEVIKNKYNGFLYDEYYEAEELLKEITGSFLKLGHIRANARKTIEKQYLNLHQALKYASAYRSLF